MIREAFGRQIDARDHLVRRQVGVEVRRITRKSMKVVEGNGTVTISSRHSNECSQSRKSDAHSGWMGGDALFTRAENGMDTVETLNRGTAFARVALVARCSRVVEVITSSSL